MHLCRELSVTATRNQCVMLMQLFLCLCVFSYRPPVLPQVFPRAHGTSQSSVVAVHRMQDLQQLSGSGEECGEWRNKHGRLAARQAASPQRALLFTFSVRWADLRHRAIPLVSLLRRAKRGGVWWNNLFWMSQSVRPNSQVFLHIRVAVLMGSSVWIFRYFFLLSHALLCRV